MSFNEKYSVWVKSNKNSTEGILKYRIVKLKANIVLMRLPLEIDLDIVVLVGDAHDHFKGTLQ